MSREIKFRAWYKGKMYAYVEHFTYGDGSSGVASLGDHKAWVEGTMFCPDSDKVELMQYTGLKDEKGREIYEGDIIKLTGTFDKQIAQVFWGKSQSTYTWVTGETWLIRILKGHVVGSEGSLLPYCEYRHGFWVHIIGNIHENPELVEMRG